MPITASSPVSTGQKYQTGDILHALVITDLTVEGQGIARYVSEQGSRVVFLDGGLPEEIVNARVTGVKKGVIHASIEEEISPSPYRIMPWCPHAETCGACTWQHFSPEAALKWKQKHVRESLARIGKLPDVPVLPVLPSPVMKEHRNKMAFMFGSRADGTATPGLRQSRTHSFVEIFACGLQPPVVMQILAAIRMNASRLGLAAWNYPRNEKGHPAKGVAARGYLRFLVVHTPEYSPDGTPQVLLEFITGPDHEGITEGNEGAGKTLRNAEALRLLAAEMMKDFPLTGVVHSERRQIADVAQADLLVQSWGEKEYLERFGHLLLRIPYNVFLQTNTAAATLLYDHIEQEAALDGTQILWDVYAGCGGIGLYLARRARMVQGFEVQNDAVRAAQNNCSSLGYAHCRFHAGGLKLAVLESLPRPDVVVLDPPRSGMEEEAIEVLLRSPASKIIYVSCDAATQARDAARLSKAWTVVKSQPIDMFPYTPHIENILVFKRNDAGSQKMHRL